MADGSGMVHRIDFAPPVPFTKSKRKSRVSDDFWTPERDQMVREAAGKYAQNQILADYWEVGEQVVMARWHVIRRVRRGS